MTADTSGEAVVQPPEEVFDAVEKKIFSEDGQNCQEAAKITRPV